MDKKKRKRDEYLLAQRDDDFAKDVIPVTVHTPLPFMWHWGAYRGALKAHFPVNFLVTDVLDIVLAYLNFSRLQCFWCCSYNGRCVYCPRCSITMCESCYKHHTEGNIEIDNCCEYCNKLLLCHPPLYGAVLCSQCYFTANNEIRSSRLKPLLLK